MRTRETRRQVDLGPSERHANVQGAFTATGDVAGHHLLIVDDVYTTGSTLRATAAAALAAGAKGIYGLTLAQPVRRPHPLEPPVSDDTVDDSTDLLYPPDVPWWEGEL
jgi:hypoxanthine-guanine phosphoribosyltransferase